MKNSRVKRVAVIVLCLFLLSSCVSNNQKSYMSAASQFNQLYFKTVECIDTSNTKESLEKLHSAENIKNIEKLKELLEQIKEYIPESKKQLLRNFEKRYEGLEYLNDTYGKIDTLTFEEGRKIFLILDSISYDKFDWNDKSSNTVWE